MQLRHSGVGIAAFGASLLATLAILGVWAIVHTLASIPAGAIHDVSLVATGLGLMLILAMLAEATAFALGIACVLQARRKRLFGVLALGIASISMVLLAALLIWVRMA